MTIRLIAFLLNLPDATRGCFIARWLGARSARGCDLGPDPHRIRRAARPMEENAKTETSCVRTTAFPAIHVLGRKLDNI
jgi:hypothetical protein